MAIIAKNTLKDSFKNGEKPDENDFANLIDSCYGFVSKAELNSSKNGILLTIPNEATGGSKQISCDLSALSLKPNFNYFTNEISIGDESEKVVIGHWVSGVEPTVANHSEWIRTKSKVGIGAGITVPEAELHVAGYMKLQDGKKVNRIASNWTDVPQGEEEAGIPNIKLLMQEKARVNTMANEMSKLISYAAVDLENVIKVFPSASNLEMKVPLVVPLSGSIWVNGSFVAPQTSVYRFDINLEISTYEYGYDTGICTKVSTQGLEYQDYLWRVGTNSTTDKRLSISTSRIYPLNAGDTVSVVLLSKGGGAITLHTDSGSKYGHFQSVCVSKVGILPLNFITNFNFTLGYIP